MLRPAPVLLGAAGLIFLWAFWPVFSDLADVWASSAVYSFGYFVPVFSAFLLWKRKDLIPKSPLKPSYAGVAILFLGLAMYLGATYFYFAWPARVSFIVTLAGAALLLGGWATMRWTWPSLLFLIFAIPLPGLIESRVLRPMQRIATVGSTNVLQTMGIFAQADGNVILLSEQELGILEACSGLSMLVTFVAISVALTFFLERPHWHKLIVVTSAFPIAVVCNVIRISITGMLYEFTSPQIADFAFHNDYAGAAFMLPLLILMQFAVLKLLDAVIVLTPEPQPEHPLIPAV